MGRTDWLATCRRTAPGILIGLSVAALASLGLTVLFSVTQAHHADPFHIIRKQALWLAIAAGAGGAAFLVDLERMRKLAWPIAAGALLLLVLVLVPGVGKKINGARRWLDLGPMNMQVSDFVKIALVFVLAHVLSLNQRHLGSFWKGFFLPCTVIAVPSLLVLVQPDYGTAFLMGAVGVTLLFLAGVRLTYLLPAAGLGVTGLATVILLNPERLDRVLSFLDVQGNKEEGAYQLWQGILAFGAGGMGGVGLGNGRQQLAFLPESHTDFIFPIIGEELGFFFTAAVVLAFFVIFAAGVSRLKRAPGLFQFILVSGALLLLTVQALINLGVVTGLLPTKGMSLPFISYGGSNLVCMFILVGLILNSFRSWERCPLRAPCEL